MAEPRRSDGPAPPPRRAVGHAAARLDSLEALLNRLGPTSTPPLVPAIEAHAVRARAALRRARRASACRPEGQGELFPGDEVSLFVRMVDLEQAVANLASAIVEILSPLDPQAPEQVRRLLETRHSGPAKVTRLDFGRPEIATWSLYTALSDDPATRAVVERLSRGGIRSVKSLVALSEPAALSLADPPIEVWVGVRRRLRELGLAFAVDGERCHQVGARRRS